MGLQEKETPMKEMMLSSLSRLRVYIRSRKLVVVVDLAAVAQHAVDEHRRDAALLPARAGVTGAGQIREPGHRGLAIGRTDDGEGCARGWLRA